MTAGGESRYARHLVLPEVGPEGQLALQEASVLVIGAGGLGSPALLYLAAAGIGSESSSNKSPSGSLVAVIVAKVVVEFDGGSGLIGNGCCTLICASGTCIGSGCGVGDGAARTRFDKRPISLIAAESCAVSVAISVRIASGCICVGCGCCGAIGTYAAPVVGHCAENATGE